jgi:hypothetical protein
MVPGLVALGLAVTLLVASSPSSSTPLCGADQLHAALAREGVAMGTIVDEFAFVNAGSHACSLDGYPLVQMLDRSRHDLATLERRAPAGTPGGGAAKKVTIARGGRAYFSVSYEDQTGFGYAVCPRATMLLIHAPGVSDALIVSGLQARIQPYGGSTIKQLRCGELSIGPVSANAL